MSKNSESNESGDQPRGKKSSSLIGLVLLVVAVAVVFGEPLFSKYLMPQHPAHSEDPLWIEVTEANFQSEVLESDLPVLVDFGAPWCGPCRQLTPTMRELAYDFEGQIRVAKVDVDANRGLIEAFQIGPIPLVMLFKEGKPVASLLGLRDRSEYESLIELHAPRTASDATAAR